MQYEVNPDWHHRCVRNTLLASICNKIDTLDILDKEKPLRRMSLSRNIVYPISEEQEEIKKLSQQFLTEMQLDINMIDSFFMEELNKIINFSNEIQQMTNKAIRINLEQSKRTVISDKMRQCLNQAAQLQNYALSNFGQLRKLCVLQDKASTFAFDAQFLLEETCKEKQFDKNEHFDQIENVLASCYSQLFNVCAKKALFEIRRKDQVQQTVAVETGMQSGFAIAIILIFLNLQAFFFRQKSNKLSAIQQMLIRSNFMVAIEFLVWSCMVMFEYKRKINYRFILGIPEGIARKEHLKVVAIGAVHICIVFITTGCCYMGIMKNNGFQIPLMFQKQVYAVIGMWKPIYWLCIPKLLIPMYITINIVKSKGKDCIASYFFESLFKIFTPWRQNIEFHHFVFCSSMCSCRDALRDIFGIISCNRAPDYVTVTLANLVNVNRVYQSWRRVRFNNQIYPHAIYMAQFGLNIFCTFNQIAKIKDITISYWIFVTTKLIDSGFKIFFDIYEDWGMVVGGSGARRFKDKPEKWAFGKYVRRPSQLTVWQVIFCHAFDYFGVSFWLLTLSPKMDYITTQFWYKTFLPCLEECRRGVWVLMRMDNQQASNVESYVETSYVPLVLDDYERKVQKKELKEQEDKQILKQLEELQDFFKTSTTEQYELAKQKMQNLSIDDTISKLKIRCSVSSINLLKDKTVVDSPRSENVTAVISTPSNFKPQKQAVLEMQKFAKAQERKLKLEALTKNVVNDLRKVKGKAIEMKDKRCSESSTTHPGTNKDTIEHESDHQRNDELSSISHSSVRSYHEEDIGRKSKTEK
ncbi:EXS_family protein [Hexamita inflata]|uniref:EXS family protein n=1 Tax=Hexamita inflata TaxID=28002 RepID=A0AA86N687_9EUKA|nr:EXS family protein [Hexamita inflata]